MRRATSSEAVQPSRPPFSFGNSGLGRQVMTPMRSTLARRALRCLLPPLHRGAPRIPARFARRSLQRCPAAMPLRNPFRRAGGVEVLDDSQRPAAERGAQNTAVAGSRPLQIKEPAEYKLSGK